MPLKSLHFLTQDTSPTFVVVLKFGRELKNNSKNTVLSRNKGSEPSLRECSLMPVRLPIHPLWKDMCTVAFVSLLAVIICSCSAHVFFSFCCIHCIQRAPPSHEISGGLCIQTWKPSWMYSVHMACVRWRFHVQHIRCTNQPVFYVAKTFGVHQKYPAPSHWSLASCEMSPNSAERMWHSDFGNHHPHSNQRRPCPPSNTRLASWTWLAGTLPANGKLTTERPTQPAICHCYGSAKNTEHWDVLAAWVFDGLWRPASLREVWQQDSHRCPSISNGPSGTQSYPETHTWIWTALGMVDWCGSWAEEGQNQNPIGETPWHHHLEWDHWGTLPILPVLS